MEAKALVVLVIFSYDEGQDNHGQSHGALEPVPEKEAF
jgi:hypothetical protein